MKSLIILHIFFANFCYYLSLSLWTRIFPEKAFGIHRSFMTRNEDGVQ